MPPKKLPSTYAEQIAEEEEEEDMLLSRFAGEAGLPDWYFICFLGFRFLLLLSRRLFLLKELISKQFVSKKVKLDSICVTLDKLFFEMSVL